MMQYTLSYPQPNTRLIRIEAKLPVQGTDPMVVKLPSWRPGRYELGNFAKNVVDVEVQNEAGAKLPFKKISTHSWEVDCANSREVRFSYQYYAAEQNAGSSWLGEEMVYVNPVNCLVYLEHLQDQPCTLIPNFPGSLEYAGGLELKENEIKADSFHQLVDSPFFAAKRLQKQEFTVEGIRVYVWFAGDCKPDMARIESHFSLFSKACIDLFGEFPTNEYHFLNLIRNDKFYHGVEHWNSTVIALGPGYQLMEDSLYNELLGVSCHEIFHTWNVKALRPAEMVPYDYSGENYSRLHYVTEGVTTYYGDLMLWKSGVWELSTYLDTINKALLSRHFGTGGKDFVTLEDASFNSWLDGYKEGVPNRKISFYTKGALVAFLLDYTIRKQTQNQYSLDDVMHRMYHRFAETGYSKENYQTVAEEVSGISMEGFFEEYISGTKDLLPALQEAADYFGLEMKKVPFGTTVARKLGIVVQNKDSAEIIRAMLPGAPAESAGLAIGDEVISINGHKCLGKVNDTLSYLQNEEELVIHYFRGERLFEARISDHHQWEGHSWAFSLKKEITDAQARNQASWNQVASHLAEALHG